MKKLVGINLGDGAKPKKKALFPKGMNAVLRNVAASNLFKYSSQKAVPNRIAALEKVEISNSNIIISLFMEDEEDASLRIVAVNSAILDNLNFKDLDEQHQAVFFPLRRRGHNFNFKDFDQIVRATDLILKSGGTKIKFENFVANEHLSLFFVFYKENEYQIYQLDLINDFEILKPSFVVDKTFPNQQSENLIFASSDSHLDFLQGKQDKVLFSQFYHAPDEKGNIRFMFGFDVERYLNNNALFPEFVPSIDVEDTLVDYKCLRYWIGDDKSFSVFDSKFPKTLHLNTIDVESLNEMILFGGIDKDVHKGSYNYHISLIVTDPTVPEAEERIRLLKKYQYQLLHYDDLTDAADFTLGELMSLFPQQFLFLKERVDSASYLSKEVTMKIVENINDLIHNIQFKLNAKKASFDLNYGTGGGLTVFGPKFSLNSGRRASRMTTLHKTYSGVEFQQPRNMGLVFDKSTDETLATLSFEKLKEYVVMYRKESNIINVNKYQPISGIKSFNESSNTYDDFKTGSFYVGASKEQIKDNNKKISKYSIEISKIITECKLKYLSSYLSSDVDGGTSIHSEEWVEIENAEQVDLLSGLGDLLIKIDSPEPTYNKYFLVRTE
tara:strand:+ start:1219 stop:3051 length:1833 start_codon:yes stop_codon:yes gene_type:complete